MWLQLSETNFLPSQKANALKSMARSIQLSPGSFGLILARTEIPSGGFNITKEYLKFLIDFLNGLCMLDQNKRCQDVKSIYQDIAVNVVFVIKEVFASFGRWRFLYSQDKEVIG